ncbi:MAG: NUDIX hydrolase [Hydrocarboniphaga effusa]|nr:NUDIX hydrolase [Hydrocarboniphaga effusa]
MHVTVATVVQRDGKFLLVEETVGPQTVLNQPAGHWEAGETLIEAARRETLEETAWQSEITSLLGVYEFEPPELGYGFLRFAFNASATRHHAQRKLDDGILRALWLSPEELRSQRQRHRSPMVQRCVEDYLSGQQQPLSLITHL